MGRFAALLAAFLALAIPAVLSAGGGMSLAPGEIASRAGFQSFIKPTISYGVWCNTNKSYDLTLDGGITTHTVPCLPNGLPDTADGDAFCATNPSADCAVARAYDNGTLGVDATQSTASAMPLWSASKSVNGYRPIVFPLKPDNLWHWLQIGSGFTWAPSANVTVMAVIQPLVSYETSVVLAKTNNVPKFNTSYSGSAPAMAIQAAAPAVSTTPAETSPVVVAFRWQSGTVTMCSNELCSAVATALSFGSTTGANVGGTDSTGNGPGGKFDLLALNIWSGTVLSDQQFAYQKTLLAERFGISQTTPINVVVQDGDSLVEGKGSSLDNSPLRFASANFTKRARRYNIAVVGQDIATALANFSANMGRLYAANPSAATFTILLEGGINDFRDGYTVDQVWANLQAYIRLARALGSNVRIVIPIEQLQCDVWQSATLYAAYQDLITRKRTLWNLPQSRGGLGADDVADMAAQAPIGTTSFPPYVAGLPVSQQPWMCNTPTNSSEGQHASDLTMAYMAVPIAAAVNRWLQ